MKFICSLSYGYQDVISEIEKNKKLLRAHLEKITFAIQRVARYGNINITDACSLFGVNRNWFYRHQKKKTCNVFF